MMIEASGGGWTDGTRGRGTRAPGEGQPGDRPTMRRRVRASSSPDGRAWLRQNEGRGYVAAAFCARAMRHGPLLGAKGAVDVGGLVPALSSPKWGRGFSPSWSGAQGPWIEKRTAASRMGKTALRKDAGQWAQAARTKRESWTSREGRHDSTAKKPAVQGSYGTRFGPLRPDRGDAAPRPRMCRVDRKGFDHRDGGGAGKQPAPVRREGLRLESVGRSCGSTSAEEFSGKSNRVSPVIRRADRARAWLLAIVRTGLIRGRECPNSGQKPSTSC